MGQTETYNLLLENKGIKFYAAEINNKLSPSMAAIDKSLKKLKKSNLIKFEIVDLSKKYFHKKVYRYWL